MLNRRDCGAAVEVAARRHLERAGLRWLASKCVSVAGSWIW